MTALQHPAVASAASAITALVANPLSIAPATVSSWSADVPVDLVVKTASPRFTGWKSPVDLAQVLKMSVLDSVPDDARKSPETFARALASAPGAALRRFLYSLLEALIKERFA